MKIRVLILCIACAAGYCADTGPAFALPSVSSVARQVDERYNHLQTLTAEFTEIYQGSGMDRTESGTLWLKKPGKMRWEYRSPEEKLFVDDGNNGWLYLPAEKQVRKSSMKKLRTFGLLLHFCWARPSWRRSWRACLLHPMSRPGTQRTWFLGEFHIGMEDTLRQVLLEITPEHAIARILLYGTDDSITEYRFSNQKENLRVPDAKFRFSPPPGVEVIVDEAAN